MVAYASLVYLIKIHDNAVQNFLMTHFLEIMLIIDTRLFIYN